MRLIPARLATLAIAALLTASDMAPAAAASRQKRAVPPPSRSREQTVRLPAAPGQPRPTTCMLDEGYGRLRSCSSGEGGGGGGM